jgi:type I restriction-modification system DNA methylase subunit
MDNKYLKIITNILRNTIGDTDQFQRAYRVIQSNQRHLLNLENFGHTYEAGLDKKQRYQSGAHFTPRILIDIITERAFEPILNRFGDKPTSRQILSLRVCDSAVGCGAFLISACRYMTNLLVDVWRTHGIPRVIGVNDLEI